MSRLLIRASAGSGKTFRLSGHFLKQLFHGDSPESILATTFTRKAAGEILGRVLLRLAEAADDGNASRRLAEFLESDQVTQQSSLRLLQEVTRNLHRMRVCTLDSFFQLLARSLTLELGLNPGWGIIDEHVDHDLKQQAIDEVLAEHASRDAQQLMQMLAKGRSKRSVRDLIDEAVANFYELFQLTEKEAWFQFPQLRRPGKDQLQQSIDHLNNLQPDLSDRLTRAVQSDLKKFMAGQWEEFVKAGIANPVFTDTFLYYNKPLPDEIVSAYTVLVQYAKAELIEQLARQTKATWELISRFDKEYTRLRSEHGGMRFSDVTRVLARSESTGDGRRLGFRLDSVIRHLLLDEFQDTSPDQWKILKRFSMSVAEAKGNTSFFCVGDGKQAIYGWRGGEAQILNAVEASIPDISTESLDLSRRSALPVIETVNRLFQHINKHQDLGDYDDACTAWQAAFPQHSTAREGIPGYAQLRTSPFFDAEGKEDRNSEWHCWVAGQIRDLYEQSQGKEIGVLTRKNATVARLVHELNLLGVPASEEGGTPPTDSPAVLAVMSLLHLSSHPGCQISRFHVSQSPLGPVIGLTTWNDSTMAVRVASQVRSQLMDLGYGQTLQKLLNQIRSHCSVRDVLRLQQVVSAGWAFDDSPSLNAADFVRLLETSRFMKSEPAPVRVMTVHQSKGLEFDIVVLPELDGQLFQTPPAAAGGNAAGEAPKFVSIWRSKKLRCMLPESLQKAFEQTVASDLSESMCLLYVAMTRAVHALHMFIKPVTAARIPKNYAGLLLATLAEERQANGDAVLYETGDAAWYEKLDAAGSKSIALNRGRSGSAVPVVKMAALKGGRRRGLLRRAPSRHDETRLFLPDAESVGSTTNLSTVSGESAGVDPRRKGTLIHAWFECIEWLTDQGGVPSETQLRAKAKELSIEPHEVDSLLPDFLECLKRPITRSAVSSAIAGSTSVENSRVFRPLANEIADGRVQLKVIPERTFVLPQQGAIVQGTIDRLVLAVRDNRNIAADIIDFKTDRLVGNVDQWKEGKLEHYAPQLQIYIDAVEHCFRVPRQCITARLLLLEADALVEVPENL